ncbi:MAG: phosphate signaling complex protein PhoU [Halofilum sp. (in: g-proteobacteria)]|nr:phosphate signaling complex protein PhoU [Halofilum sp. (in: g-proteobacteria)]
MSQEFDEELASIRNKVLTMGGLVEKQLSDGLKALLTGDSQLGDNVVEGDFRVNSMEVEIDEECTQVIARRQPTASDLRVVVTIIKTITDLERVGDEADKLGRFAAEIAREGGFRHQGMLTSVENLGEHVRRMLHDTLDVFARMDVQAALQVAGEESKIDQEYDGVVRQLITHMMEDPRSTRGVLSVLWCARALERVADHARNMCEYVVYMVEGKDIRHTSLEKATREIQKSREAESGSE